VVVVVGGEVELPGIQVAARICAGRKKSDRTTHQMRRILRGAEGTGFDREFEIESAAVGLGGGGGGGELRCGAAASESGGGMRVLLVSRWQWRTGVACVGRTTWGTVTVRPVLLLLMGKGRKVGAVPRAKRERVVTPPPFPRRNHRQQRQRCKMREDLKCVN
jgi:hypothetical protein